MPGPSSTSSGGMLAAPSGLRLKVTKRIERCAATNVDPATGLRDLQIPKASCRPTAISIAASMPKFSSGALAPGDRFEAEASFQAALPF